MQSSCVAQWRAGVASPRWKRSTQLECRDAHITQLGWGTCGSLLGLGIVSCGLLGAGGGEGDEGGFFSSVEDV